MLILLYLVDGQSLLRRGIQQLILYCTPSHDEIESLVA